MPAPKYPWTDWLVVRKVKVITRGKDFTCSVDSMSQQVRNAARAMGLMVSVRVQEGGHLVISTRNRKPHETYE